MLDTRVALGRVVESMNKTGGFADRQQLTLELLRWETHVSPDAGQPQAVVFGQLNPALWDVFVGVLWTRFGTETGNVDPETGRTYRSGTEEEFHAALRQRQQSNSGWPKIMLYRCRKPADPSKIDPAQLGRIQQFFAACESGAEHPCLIREFGECNDFENKVREDLERAVAEYVEQYKAPGDASLTGGPPHPLAGPGSLLPIAQRPVTVPHLFQAVLDWWVPSILTFLTRKVRVFRPPSEWAALNSYLRELRCNIAKDIEAKTYVEPPTKDLVSSTEDFAAKRSGFLTPIQQLIKEIIGVSHGGDAQNASIAAISRKSRLVRHIVSRLLCAEEPLVLLGDPGSGKSITLQQTAMLIAEKETKRMFPSVCLFVRVGDFHVSGDVDHHSVWEYVKKKTPPDLQPYLDDLDTNGRLVIFFDGLDEMSRERYNEHTSALSTFAEHRKGYTKTLFSCRVTDFTPEFRHQRLVLLAFNRSHIRAYLERQIHSFPLRVGDRDWTARQLARRLAEGDLPMQADNPFVLWMLCGFLQDKQDWPQSRVHLIEYYNQANYERKRRDAERKPHAFDASCEAMPPQEIAFQAWGRIAYEITGRNVGTTIALDDVKQLLSPAELPALAAGIRCGVLQESLDLATVLLRFEHHRFQEYFTALYLKGNAQAKASLSWLDKLDAPRWQETLFNLVLMGGGDEALKALKDAIEEGYKQLEELWREEDATQASVAETTLADRVELASRVLRQIQRRPDGGDPELAESFRHIAYSLADRGNPITQVKMLWASRSVKDIDSFRVAKEPLASPVIWVRQQAFVVTSASTGPVSGEALKEDLLHSFASGKFLHRIGDYVRVASQLKQSRLWRVLAIGLLLYLVQCGVALGTVAAFRDYVPRALSAISSFGEHQDQELHAFRWKRALERRDGEELSRLAENRDKGRQQTAQAKAMVPAANQVLHSPRVSLFGALGLIVTLAYLIRRHPGPHLLAIQTIGCACSGITFVLYALWMGQGLSAVLLSVQLLPLFCVSLAGIWAVALLSETFTFMLFAQATYQRSGPRRMKRVWLEALWDNSHFKSWLKAAFGGLGYFAIVSLSFLGFTVWRKWDSIVRFLVLHVGLLPFLPSFANITLSLALCALVIVLTIGAWRQVRNRRQMRQLGLPLSWDGILRIVPWTVACLGTAAVALMLWGITFINWGRLNLFPSLPTAVGAILSAGVYLEGVGSLWVAAMWCIGSDPARRSVHRTLFVWSIVSFAPGILALLVWGLVLLDWAWIGHHLGLYPALPSVANTILSILTYVESAGVVWGAATWRGRGAKAWRSGLRILTVWSTVCFALALLTLVIWGLTMLDWVWIGHRLGLYPALPPVANAALSLLTYAEAIGVLNAMAVLLRKGRGAGLQLLRSWTSVCVVGLAAMLALWGLFAVSEYRFGRFLTLAILLTMGILVLIQSWMVLQPLLLIAAPMWPRRYTLAEWRTAFQRVGPQSQAALLHVRPSDLGLTAAAFQILLREVQSYVKAEPAQTAYWGKRYQIEEILRHEKVG